MFQPREPNELRQKASFWTSRVALYLILVLFGLVLIFPFIYMIVASLKTPLDFSANPRRLLPYTQEKATFNGKPANLYQFSVDGEAQEFAEAVINPARNDVNKLRIGNFARPDGMRTVLANAEHIPARQSNAYDVMLEMPIEYSPAPGEEIELDELEAPLTLRRTDQTLQRVTRDSGAAVTFSYAVYRVYLDGEPQSHYLETGNTDEAGQATPLVAYVPGVNFGDLPDEITLTNLGAERTFTDVTGNERDYDAYQIAYNGTTEEIILFFTPRLSVFVSTADDQLATFASADINKRVEQVEFRFENYDVLLTLENFDRALVNTAFVTILVVLGQVTTSVFGGYAFSRVEFKGRDTIFMAYLGSIMIPFVVLIVPMYRLMESIGWRAHIVSLIVPWIFTAYGTFLMRQFFMSIPVEIEEAALLDGASRFRILWQIFLPLSTPAIATQAIFTFLYAWNSFLWPLFMFGDQPSPLRVLTLSLISLANRASSGEPNLVFTGAAVTILPPMIVFILAQKYFVEGIATSGLKG